MDRFERLKGNQVIDIERDTEIYIPIWIDLKAVAGLRPPPTKCIYIPIWIDLKVQNFLVNIGNISLFTFQYG